MLTPSILFFLELRNRDMLLRISPAGKQILAMMLEVDPSKRLTASEALQHPWFQGLKLDPLEVILLCPVLQSKFVPLTKMNVGITRVESVPDIDMGFAESNPCGVLRRSSLLNASMIKDSLKMISTAINVSKSDTRNLNEVKAKKQVTFVSKARCFFSFARFFSLKN